MNQTYIVLERIHVQDANCIAGLTFGFPAITQFLGFSHALQLKMQDTYPFKVNGCAVFCHSHNSHTYQAKGFGDYTFIQRKSSPTFSKHAKESPPIIEEGKMNLCVSLVLSCESLNISRRNQAEAIKKQILHQVHRLRLAGGSITKIEDISILNQAESIDSQNMMLKLIQRKLMPSFVLCDRTSILIDHYDTLKKEDDNIDLLDAWLDFSRLTYEAQSSQLDDPLTASNDIDWLLKTRPTKGWLVPIMTGFTAISSLQDRNTVMGARSPNYPFSFVESVYSIGEWLSTHRVNNLEDLMWQYNYQPDWYVCQQRNNSNEDNAVNKDDENDLYDFDYTL